MFFFLKTVSFIVWLNEFLQLGVRPFKYDSCMCELTVSPSLRTVISEIFPSCVFLGSESHVTVMIEGKRFWCTVDDVQTKGMMGLYPFF